jgi:hypothetical protein
MPDFVPAKFQGLYGQDVLPWFGKTDSTVYYHWFRSMVNPQYGFKMQK